MIPSALGIIGLFYIKNEVGFKCQRSLLQVPMKLASLGIEAGFIFFDGFMQKSTIGYISTI